MDFAFSRSYRGALQAVIFDWAGTTVDYGCFAPAGVFVEVFKEKGVEISMDEARGPMGMHKRDHIRIVSQMDRVAQVWKEQHGRPCTEEDVEAMFEQFVPRQLEIISRHADLVPELLVAQAGLRRRKLKIGSTTGYNNEMMDILTVEARRRGYEPDNVVCATDVPAGRPAPWMALQNAMQLGVYPMEACVKVGDTVADIDEGLNAGMWSVGVLLSSNEMGMSLEQIRLGDPEQVEARKMRAKLRLLQAGAHYVIDTLTDLEWLLDEIEGRVRRGERP